MSRTSTLSSHDYYQCSCNHYMLLNPRQTIANIEKAFRDGAFYANTVRIHEPSATASVRNSSEADFLVSVVYYVDREEAGNTTVAEGTVYMPGGNRRTCVITYYASYEHAVLQFTD